MTQPDDAHVDRGRPLLFAEATGKTVASIRVNQGPGWHVLEVRFTDETFFWFELIPRIAVEVRYMEQTRGDVEILRDYGSFPKEGRPT